MTPSSDLLPPGERIRTAVRWISETLQTCPERSRRDVVREAAVRFDLTPLECEYLSFPPDCGGQSSTQDDP